MGGGGVKVGLKSIAGMGPLGQTNGSLRILTDGRSRMYLKLN